MSDILWRRIGWRSIRKVGLPKLIVRFNKTSAKPKFLDNAIVSAKDKAVLIDSANEFWASQPKGKDYGKP